MTRIVTFILSILLGASAAATLATAQQPTPLPAACPDRLVDASSLVCSCSAEAAASGSVWGDELYSDDSAICRSAVHAGTIGEGGGIVWVFERPGQNSYLSVTRNGVPSSSWGMWRRSIAFRPASEAPESDIDPAVAACPVNVRGQVAGATLTCSCTIAAMGSGAIWGDGFYTSDSILCRAARHAGAVGPYGGTVRARVTAGRASYPAATRNGITSGSWPSYPTSLAFDR